MLTGAYIFAGYNMIKVCTFVHQHRAAAGSWRSDAVLSLQEQEGIYRVNMGTQKIKNDKSVIGYLTNAREIADSMKDKWTLGTQPWCGIEVSKERMEDIKEEQVHKRIIGALGKTMRRDEG